jgi:hypothetical protein
MGVRKDTKPKKQSHQPQTGMFSKNQRNGEDLDLSSIKSDVSDYVPQRKEILGTKVKPAQPVQPNKNAARIVFEEEKEDPVHGPNPVRPQRLPQRQRPAETAGTRPNRLQARWSEVT